MLGRSGGKVTEVPFPYGLVVGGTLNPSLLTHSLHAGLISFMRTVSFISVSTLHLLFFIL